MPSYFLPPVQRRLPLPERTPEIRSPRYRSFLWTWFGGQDDLVIAGSSYRGGYWNGPLSTGQIAEITAAGYGARIVAVTDLIQLPPDLDST